MYSMFENTAFFNGEISTWDVSSVKDMHGMFFKAQTFDRDISKWDVSSVTNMDRMFHLATSFKRNLCGAAWVKSKASKKHMFEGSHGSISTTVCMSSVEVPISLSLHVPRRPLPERELIVHTPITTSISKAAITSTSGTTMGCPKCGTFEKSGRASCCAPGGAWYKKCGASGSTNVEHRWFEGVEACERKSKAVHVYNEQTVVVRCFSVSLANPCI